MKVKSGDRFGMKVIKSEIDDFCNVEFYINGYCSHTDSIETQGKMYFYLIFANCKSKSTVISTKFNHPR